MEFLPVVLAGSSNPTATVLVLLPVASIVWLLIWFLLRTGQSDKDLVFDPGTADETAEPSDADARESTENGPADAAPPPLPGSDEPEFPEVFTDSQAFTVWTKSTGAGEEAGDSPEPEFPSVFAGSKAFSVWADATGSGEGDAGGDEDPEPVLDTATAEEAAAQFKDDLDSGKARQDAELGILYDEAPDDDDDLREIKGVGKVLEGKLHDFGVYRYKQIAFWTDTAVAEFAKRLSFKDRIYRDDWIAQAKDLHEKKFGEKF